MDVTTVNNPSSSIQPASLFTLPSEMFEAIRQWLPSVRSVITLGLTCRTGKARVAHIVAEHIRSEYPQVPKAQYAHDPMGFYLRRKQMESKLFEGNGFWKPLGVLPSRVKVCGVFSRRDGVSEVIYSMPRILNYDVWVFELNHRNTNRECHRLDMTSEQAEDLTSWLGEKEPVYCDFQDFGIAMVTWQPIASSSDSVKSVKVTVRSIRRPSMERIATFAGWNAVKLLSAHRNCIFAVGFGDKQNGTKSTKVLLWDVLSNKQRHIEFGSIPGWAWEYDRGFRLNDRAPREWLQWNQEIPPMIAWAWHPSRGGVWFANFRAFTPGSRATPILVLKNPPHPVHWLQRTQKGLLMGAEPAGNPTSGTNPPPRVSVLPYKALQATKGSTIDWKEHGLSVQTLDARLLPAPFEERMKITNWYRTAVKVSLRRPNLFRSVPLRTSSMVTGPLSCMLIARADFVGESDRFDASMQDDAAHLSILKQTHKGTFQSTVRRYTDVARRGDSRYQWGYWKGQPTIVRLDRATRLVNAHAGGIILAPRVPQYLQAIRISVFECFRDYSETTSAPERREQNRLRSMLADSSRSCSTSTPLRRHRSSMVQASHSQTQQSGAARTPNQSRPLPLSRHQCAEPSSKKRRRLG